MTSSISAFNEDDDYNYFIETTQNIPFPSKPPNPPRHKINSPLNFSKEYNNTNQNYISKLEKKISLQSKTIIELEKNNYICEQFIKKLNPYQTFPITEEMLSNNYEIIKDPINAAEQQNYTDLLKKTIENELIKNGLLNHNINAEGVIDLAKIRLESEEYKKQLVLAQSMINSLKNDLIELTKENEEYKMNKEKNTNINNNESININNQIFDINQKLMSYKNNYEKINQDFEKLLNEKKNIKNENNIIKKENNQLKLKIKNLENEINKNDLIKKNKNINENKTKEEINNIDYKKKYEDLLAQFHKNIEKNIDNDEKIKNYNNIKEENNKLINENKKLKEDINNLIKQKNIIENENKEDKNKIIELNKKYEKIEKENEELKEEINKLKENENDKENYNYYIDDTEDENFFGKKKDDTINENNTNENKVNLFPKENYNELNNKYNDIFNKYTNLKKEKDKIKEIFRKREKINNKNNNQIELKKLIENSIDFKNNNNDSFDYNKINYILWEMDEDIKEKEKIINEIKIKKEELENEVVEKFKYYDEYISNNKNNIKNLLSILFNLLVQFKEKINIIFKNKNNNICEYFSSQFISDVDKIINQINAINNISNYDIELNDNIFFDTINNFISLLGQEIAIIFNKNYSYKKYNFNNYKNEENKNNNDELFSKINYLKNDRNEIVKEYTELKIQNHSINKENSKLKNEIIDIDNKLKEMTLKYKCNQKTILVNNEGKKLLFNAIYKFIKNISDKELVKIIYDILNIMEQINTTQLNKCLVEEKLNIMENNQNINEAKNELGLYLIKERNKLKILIEDYNNKIKTKSEILDKLSEDYNKKESIYTNYIKDLKEKNEFLLNDIEEMRNKLNLIERENYKLKYNYIVDKEQSEKGTFHNTSDQIYNKTIELLNKNKKINNYKL